MRYAIVEDGKVTNIVISNLQMKENWFAIPIGCPAAVGDSYAGGCFYAPDGTLRITPEMRAMQEVYEAAYMEGVQDA